MSDTPTVWGVHVGTEPVEKNYIGIRVVRPR